MRWPLLLVFIGGCSLFLGEDSNADRDAAVDPDGSTPLDAAVDATPVNTNDHTRPYSCDDDTIALYKFNEDDIGNDECGALNHTMGGTLTVSHPEFQDAALINSRNSVHYSGESTTITFTDQLTLEGWMLPPMALSPDSNMWLIYGGNAAYVQGGRKFAFGLVGNPDGTWRLRAEIFRADCDNPEILEAPAAIDSAWHHIAATVELIGGNIKVEFFLDGAAMGGGTTTTMLGVCGDPVSSLLMVGGFAPTTNITGVFGHAIDEVRISRTIRDFTPR